MGAITRLKDFGLVCATVLTLNFGALAMGKIVLWFKEGSKETLKNAAHPELAAGSQYSVVITCAIAFTIIIAIIIGQIGTLAKCSQKGDEYNIKVEDFKKPVGEEEK